MRTFTSRAPVRVDFFGGWTDLPLFSELVEGLVLSAAIRLYTYATVSPSDSLVVYSEDFELKQVISDIHKIEYNGTLDLTKAACVNMGIDKLEIRTRSDAPAGSGLGTSASLAVAVLGALNKYSQKGLLGSAIAKLAYSLEVNDLGLFSGTQDQYAAAFGNILVLHCKGDFVTYDLFRSSSSDPVRLELEKRCLLVYTGKARLSSSIHRYVREAFSQKRNWDAILGLVDVTKRGIEAFWNEDIDSFGALMLENWEYQKEMHECVSNPLIDGIFELALRSGAIGGKACGAGGGGCLLFVAKPGEEHKLRKAFVENNIEVLPFFIDDTGLCVW